MCHHIQQQSGRVAKTRCPELGKRQAKALSHMVSETPSETWKAILEMSRLLSHNFLMKQSWGLMKISSHDISMRVRRKRGARKEVKHACKYGGGFLKGKSQKERPTQVCWWMVSL